MSRKVEKREKVDAKLLEKSVVETALPCHMLWTMAQSVVAGGYQLRPDILQRLNAGAAAPLAVLDNDDGIRRVAKRVDELARMLLFALSPDDPVHGFYSCAMFCLKLVDEGYLDDVTNMAVLVSMLLIDELKEEGGVESYPFKELLLKQEAGKLLSRAQKEGIYDVQLIAPVVG